MNKDASFKAVKEIIGNRDPFLGKAKVFVENKHNKYVYNNISVHIAYNIGYMQMDVDVFWEEGDEQIPYKELNLHGKYNTTYQNFKYENGILCWIDGDNKISLVII